MSTQNEADHHPDSAPVHGTTDPIQILDADGAVLSNAELPELSDDDLVAMYEDIKLARRFDQRAISLQRQGRIATYAPMTGQEGAQVATGYALATQDWLLPTYREHAAKYVHGMDLASLLKPLCGLREGYAIPDDVHVMPEYIPIATQVPQATGMAWGKQLQGEADTAVLCHFGDGATSEGDFHEGLNFAGVFDVPAVFVCNNNQWAISVPREHQTASETIAQKAAAYGIEGVRVDGLDPLAVYAVTRAALQKAKNPADGERRPTLIEAVQYRYGAHTTADDPSAYREEDEAEDWRQKDPLDRMRNFLTNNGLLDDDLEAEIDERIDAQLSEAIESVEAATTDPTTMFDHVYDELPPRLREQRAELESLREKYGDEAFHEVLE
ncbi:pyruvate dehydrogenase (acetyl-transferring) E1 component subunit alpha [Natrialba hulunbeirensis JCM 10989]|uniref:Pyruvate dehydrogenase (Acetyl-transferring) E1 component subunit alpha n=1 Tax=Natrialba hulunbeirensis JCM 10989 TaxID=1227493 RepID=M0A3I4_9EURY|nr:pyruvate dehydrogenase (acetyl-transferring) E1 component subunit alpha [Natrialba hulunbeirensis]ELY91903.1 pyruvate dehydrogenase (acetyl-transferring) E1 component subunit alpha [Natrialba hulunbeirensis JCM 10989]